MALPFCPGGHIEQFNLQRWSQVEGRKAQDVREDGPVHAPPAHSRWKPGDIYRRWLVQLCLPLQGRAGPPLFVEKYQPKTTQHSVQKTRRSAAETRDPAAEPEWRDDSGALLVHVWNFDLQDRPCSPPESCCRRFGDVPLQKSGDEEVLPHLRSALDPCAVRLGRKNRTCLLVGYCMARAIL